MAMKYCMTIVILIKSLSFDERCLYVDMHLSSQSSLINPISINVSTSGIQTTTFEINKM